MTDTDRRDAAIERAARRYAALLRLYPAEHRRTFGRHMQQTFKDQYRDAYAYQEVGLAFWLAVIGDALRSSMREHVMSLNTRRIDDAVMGMTIIVLGNILIFPQGIVAPPHVHDNAEEAFFVLEGDLVFTLGDDDQEIVAPPGTYVYIPPGTRHSFRCGSEVGRVYNTLVKVPDLDPATADDGLLASLLTLSDVYGTGWHAARRADVHAGDTVAVIGDGAVGLLAVLSAKQLGAERIILMGRHQARTDLGRSKRPRRPTPPWTPGKRSRS